MRIVVAIRYAGVTEQVERVEVASIEEAREYALASLEGWIDDGDLEVAWRVDVDAET